MPRSIHYVLLLLLTAPASAQTVDHVEPPNWWVGMHWNEVQLMVYGDDLAGAAASFDDPRLRVTATASLESDSYLFVDVVIPDDLEPGTYRLTVRRGSWEASLDWPIHSREVDASKHQGFWSDDVVYLVTPDRFANGNAANDCIDGLAECADRSRPGARHGGDLQGLVDRLDYLADLGVTALWLNPVLENAGRQSYHGYATTDLYRIDSRLGTNEEYRRLVDEAHARGLKVIFDHVNNHIGIRHPWIEDLPRASWLNGTPGDHDRDQHYKLAVWDAYGDPETVDRLTDFWFVDSMPDLNQRDPYVARYLIQNTLWWIEFAGLDGIREDTYPYPDQAYMASWAATVLAEYPAFNIVGEVWENHSAYLAAWQEGSPVPDALDTNLPTVMDFALTRAMRTYLSGHSDLAGIYAVIAQDRLYANPSNLLTFVDNHDMSRAHFVAAGETRRVEQMLALLLTSRGIPQLLYGMELGMVAGESHTALRADFPGGFPEDDRDAFTPEGRTAYENAAFDLTRRLLHLRRSHAALRTGTLIHYPPTNGDNAYRYLRRDAEATIMVVINGDDMQKTLSLDLMAHQLPEGARFRDLLQDRILDASVGTGIPVDALGFRILLVE